MNKNTTALILIVLAIAIYFTFTRARIAELRSIQAVNLEYQEAIDNSKSLVEIRDNVLRAYNSISETDRLRLNKIVPDNVDNVRLIIDVKDDIAARHGLFLKNIKTAAPESSSNDTSPYGVVTLSFTVTAPYETFVNFLKDLEASLRIMDVTKLTIASKEPGTFDFNVEVKTYWLKQK